MLRANIYTLEPLVPEMRGAVLEGVEMLADYIGEIIATSEREIRLPLNWRGYVEPGRLPLSYLDQTVELHMLAVPFDPGPDGLGMGLGYYGMGCTYVDTSRLSPDSTRITAAHENTHGLGFVTSGANHEDPTSRHHCCTHDCIMHRQEVTRTRFQEAPVGDAQSEFDRMMRTRSVRRPILVTREGQQDFCKPCKSDMRANAPGNVEDLRRNRPIHWEGVM